MPVKANYPHTKMRSLTSRTIVCQLCLPSLQASSTDADVYNMCEVDAGTTDASGESAVPGLGSAAPDSGGPGTIPAPPGSRPALVGPAGPAGPAGPPDLAAEPAAAVNSPQRQQPKQERTRSAELLLQMLHERRLNPANSVPARNPLELKRSLKLELKQSDSAEAGTGTGTCTGTGTGIVGGHKSAARAAAAEPTSEICLDRLGQDRTPTQSSAWLGRSSRSITSTPTSRACRLRRTGPTTRWGWRMQLWDR